MVNPWRAISTFTAVSLIFFSTVKPGEGAAIKGRSFGIGHKRGRSMKKRVKQGHRYKRQYDDQGQVQYNMSPPSWMTFQNFTEDQQDVILDFWDD